jgi:hypothetical protein
MGPRESEERADRLGSSWREEGLAGCDVGAHLRTRRFRGHWTKRRVCTSINLNAQKRTAWHGMRLDWKQGKRGCRGSASLGHVVKLMRQFSREAREGESAREKRSCPSGLAPSPPPLTRTRLARVLYTRSRWLAKSPAQPEETAPHPRSVREPEENRSDASSCTCVYAPPATAAERPAARRPLDERDAAFQRAQQPQAATLYAVSLTREGCDRPAANSSSVTNPRPAKHRPTRSATQERSVRAYLLIA